MSISTALLSGGMIWAIGVHAVLTLLVVILISWLEERVREVAFTHWVVEALGLPLAKAAVLVLFVLLAYPLLYGLEQAPSLGEILFSGEGRIQSLVNWVFLVSLLLPWVPLIGSIHALVLPVQGITAAALLFHWLALELGHNQVVWWPGGINALLVLLIAVLGHRLAWAVSLRAGDRVARLAHLKDAHQLVYQSVVLGLQAPSILIYAIGVGAQLSLPSSSV